MSTEPDTLTEADRDLLEHLDGEDEEALSQAQIEELRRRNRQLEAEVEDLRDELTAWKQTVASRLNELGDRVNGRDPSDPRAGNFYEDLTILEKYSRMSNAEREELLGGNPSKLRAVKIFENWSDWSRTVQAGQLISTNHTRGRYNKIALKVDLQSATDEDLQNVEVYRAMKMVAKLSAQERDDVETITDEFDREHIHGGAFEYHEKVNPDSGDHFKILKLVDEGAVTFP